MQMPSLGKNPTNYEVERKETCEYEKKPLSFNDFNDAEEEEIKKCAAKRKERRRELAEYLKAQKQQKEKPKRKKKKKNCGSVLENSIGNLRTLKRLKKEAKRMSEKIKN